MCSPTCRLGSETKDGAQEICKVTKQDRQFCGSTKGDYKKVTHVIFDLDGLLLDTEARCTVAMRIVLTPYGKNFDWRVKEKIMGGTGLEMAKKLVEIFNLPLTPQELYALVTEQYKVIMPDAQIMPDTESVYRRVHADVISGYGKQYTIEIGMKVMGTREEDGARVYIKELDLPCTVQELVSKFQQEAYKVLADSKLMPDTEPKYTTAFENVLSAFGKTFDTSVKAKTMGRLGPEMSRIMVQHFDLPVTPEEFYTLLKEQYKVMFADVKFLPGAEDLVKHLHSHNIPLAVATSSSTDSYNLKTQKLKDFFSLFHHITCGGSDPDVKQGKPSPDVFLVCARKFPDSPKPEDCLVFEDAPNGVLAAKAAGMQVVMVPDKLTDPELCKPATLKLNSLAEVQPELFGLPPRQ